MGAASSIDLRPEEIADLREETGFSSKQVTHLYKRFRKLDRGEKGVIATKDFYMIPELAMNPIAPRLAEVVGMSGGTAVNFREFLRFLSLFGEQNSHSDQRIQLLFKVYDVSGTQEITEGDLRTVIRMQVGDCCSEQQVADIVRHTMEQADADQDGVINFTDFVQSVRGLRLDKTLTVDFDSMAEDD